MTATKAVAGAVAGNLVTIALWGLASIPGWASVPDAPKASIIALVSGAIGAACVYFAPPNKPTVEMQSTGRFDE